MASENKISYYSLRLKELLNNSFPELSGDKKIIEQRGQLAAKVYNDAFIAGNTIEQCNEIANYVLFEGLHFSKFAYLQAKDNFSMELINTMQIENKASL